MAARGTYRFLHLALGIAPIWWARARERRQLLDFVEAKPHLLTDIGVSKSDALAEAHRPFWRPWILGRCPGPGATSERAQAD